MATISSRVSGAIMVANIDQPPYNNPSSTIMLSGYSTMVWVGVTTTNMDRMLSLLDSSIVQTSSRIHPGVWSKRVRCRVQNNIRECLNVGTVPTYKMHNIGTVPTFVWSWNLNCMAKINGHLLCQFIYLSHLELIF